MLPIVALLVALVALLPSCSAATWNFLRYNLPSSQAFLSFSGTMAIPKLPKAGTYYLWPGLQPTDNSGVYQNVLDGRSGTWWIGSGWCCSNPNLPWGSGFNVAQGDSVAFSNTKDASGGNWTSTLVKGSQSVKNSFPLGSKTFNQVLFAIELTGVSWDFGPLAFSNVVIVSSVVLAARLFLTAIDVVRHGYQVVHQCAGKLQQRDELRDFRRECERQQQRGYV